MSHRQADGYTYKQTQTKKKKKCRHNANPRATYHKRLSKCEVSEEDILLKYVANVTFVALAQSFPTYGDGAAGRSEAPTDRVQQRGLARAWGGGGE